MADGFITIPLSEADERALREAAAARGVPVEEEAARLLTAALDAGRWASEDDVEAALATHGVERP